LYRFVQGFLVSAGDRYFGAFVLQTLGGCQSDTAVSAGYYRNFPFESLHLPSPDL
jgi:hypothetical protein